MNSDVSVLLADGFDDALIGVAQRFGWLEPVAVYDLDKCLEIIMRDGCTYEEAREHFDYNVIGAWVGEQTPIYVRRPCDECGLFCECGCRPW
jgi:hypothetical protein